MKPFISLVFVSLLFFAACTKNVYVSVMKPAPLTVPRHIQTVAIINRTLPENKTANIIEGILTGEMPGQDKQGAFEALAGLNSRLQSTTRFTPILTNIKLKGSGSGGILPEPMSWREISEICEANQADAVISLETYDSDFIVTHANKLEEKKDKDGNVVKKKVFYANGVATVKLGFRLYDPSNNSISDQFTFTHTMNWSTSGSSPIQAAAGLIGRNQAINQASQAGGTRYGSRISPAWVRVRREFYKKAKGAPQMKVAERKASVNDWEGAEQIWKQVVDRNLGKTSGKAAYNIAVAKEVMGDLYGAKEWAKIAYTDYNIKKAVDYTYVLNRRIRDQEILEEQMGE